ncbi:abc transporter [Capsaspora owczarzaki ATCC 30864]|uniref:ATP-binding cassette sub-family B member 6 n=1 Tax=Capsaspora owczarzaki (strain ATCC 30864) TaxID=595528 RepID=A0A0D2WIQ2_CAPO3|nr:abc transporter [Capsaspora owczarzaki ATCC 30864]KJE88983.1 abc transporter [Capsaspora owczarzaki ATCC 30864]|eukprot:XP_004365418.2 abc transporter [Capsaspora owczarzaki ATCC 30864]
MLEFCHNDTLTIEWSADAFSICFLDTLGSTSLAGFMAVYGSVKLWRLFTSPKIARAVSPAISFHVLHLVAALIILLCYPAVMIAHAALDSSRIYGSAVMSACLHVFAWSYLLVVVRISRIKSVAHHKVVFVFYMMAVLEVNMELASVNGENVYFRLKDGLHVASFATFIIRYALTTLMPVFALLDNRQLKLALAAGYVAINGDEQLADDGGKQAPSSKPPGASSSDDDIFQGNTFHDFRRRIKLLWPYLWPRNDRLLQFYVIVCLTLLAAGRGINVLVPIYNKQMVNDLTPDPVTKALEMPYKDIGIYILLIFIQGGSVGSTGLLNSLRSCLWVKISQYTDRTIRLKMFNHIHSLSLRWHMSKKTGEVLRVMDRGTDSIDTLLSAILFNILPTFVDIAIAIGYFIYTFNVWFGVIVFVAMSLYVGFTVSITEWRTKFRRKMNKMDNESRAKAVDSLLNFETVKYYEAERVEAERYERSILDYQAEEWRSNFTLNLLNCGQTLIITAGLAAGCMYCGYKVAAGELTVGDFVLFLSYVVQLYAPLNMFGSWYRLLTQYFIDMENMFDLLAVEPEVKDIPTAQALSVTSGEVKFDNVHFAYDPAKPVLKGISFTIPAGQTFALVGASGSGKSTIVRLLFRFYDLVSGTITIDGQDISQVQQASLRRAIGVVPQDTVLFHDTIRYNIRYGRQDATEAELENATRAAEMHDKIMSFPDKYNTVVGERGLRLSGGEKQRVAIARTILKAPQIVMLDEATSALDTIVERQIQASLARVCDNRTTLVVAHRLSTIIGADQILVLQDGEVIERGSHAELLSLGGKYKHLWQQQLESSKAAAPSSSGSLPTDSNAPSSSATPVSGNP